MERKKRRRKLKFRRGPSDIDTCDSGEHQLQLVYLPERHPRGPAVPQSYKMRCANPGCMWEHSVASYALDSWCFQGRHVWDYWVGGGNLLHRECRWCGRAETETHQGWVMTQAKRRDADS